MLIQVISPSSSVPRTSEPSFILQQDRWNDYSFQTLYHLYLTHPEEKEAEYIGAVKILKRGQTESDTLQISTGILDAGLNDDFCSVGQSLDYYERLAGIEADWRTFILQSLQDIVHIPIRQEQFKEEKGWSISLFRDFKESDFLEVARVLLERDYSAFPDLDNLSFTVQMSGWVEPITMRFNAPEGGQGILPMSPFAPPPRGLPDRAAVLIGRNGAGKSTMLANLARILHASPDDRMNDKLLQLGRIEPAGLGFTRIVAIAFSAFDSFEVPGRGRDERMQISKDITTGKGRYVFCGLRNIVEELEQGLLRSEDNPPHSFSSEDDSIGRDGHTLLKSGTQQADEFIQTLEHIKNHNRTQLLEWAMAPLLAEPSFSNILVEVGRPIFGKDPRASFLSWSTGHKIVIQIITSLVAYTERKSIVLFDEPESHLHPPLLAALMHAFRIVLEENDAFAIVATHSPVVVQETMSRHVHYVHREGGQIRFSSPKIQTFGENIGTITSEVFKLTSNETDFHRVLDNLITTYNDIDQIEELLDDSLSVQARAYILSRIAGKGGDGQ